MTDTGQALRAGLEFAVAIQFAVVSAYLMFKRGGDRLAGQRVGALSVVLALCMLLNVGTSHNSTTRLRDWTAVLEAAIPPLIYLVINALSRRSTPRQLLMLTGPSIISGLLLIFGAYGWIAPWVLAVIAVFLGASIFSNRTANGARSASRFATLLILWLMTFGLIRAAVEIEVHLGIPYRSSTGYLIGLCALVILSASIMLLCLMDPRVLIAPPKYQSSYLSADNVNEIRERIDAALNNAKIYRDPDLTLASAAHLVGATEREFSQVVNDRFGANFSALMNRLRVEDAAVRLRREPTVPITTILYDVGFGSKSAFQREFRRRFGTSPSEYRIQNRMPDDQGL